MIRRGIQAYVLLLGGFASLALVWGTNTYVLESTTPETGWPLLIGVAGGILLVVIGLRRLFATPADEPTTDTLPWNSRK